MKASFGSLIILAGLAACSTNSQKAGDESTKVATDTLVETKQVADTMVVKKETTVAADTDRQGGYHHRGRYLGYRDTTVAADTSHVGDQGVIKVDTTKAK